jgi:hypothetical protein
MKILDNYLEARQKLLEFFDLGDAWVEHPIDDKRSSFWKIEGHDIYYADSFKELEEESGECYHATFPGQSSNVFRKEDFTLVLARDCMGKMALILDNSKEVK